MPTAEHLRLFHLTTKVFVLYTGNFSDHGCAVPQVLPQVVAKVSALLPPDSYDWSGRTAGLSRAGLNEGATSEEARERGEVQRSFYSLLHALVHNALGSFLLAAGDSVVQPTLNAVIQGAALHCDAAARRSCIQVPHTHAACWLYLHMYCLLLV